MIALNGVQASRPAQHQQARPTPCQGELTAGHRRKQSHDGPCQGLRRQFVPRVGDGKNCFGRFGRSGGHPNSAVVGVASSIWLR
jgi:hypothetical protein